MKNAFEYEAELASAKNAYSIVLEASQKMYSRMEAAERRNVELIDAGQELINTLYCESSEGIAAVERFSELTK